MAIRSEIQALRGIAVAIVVVSHLWPSALPGGFVGVDVFFVVSGFLITVASRPRDRPRRPRRARRVLGAARAAHPAGGADRPAGVRAGHASRSSPRRAGRSSWARSARAPRTSRTGGSRRTRSTTSPRRTAPPPCSTTGRCRRRSSSTSSGRVAAQRRRHRRSAPLPAPRARGADGRAGPGQPDLLDPPHDRAIPPPPTSSRPPVRGSSPPADCSRCSPARTGCRPRRAPPSAGSGSRAIGARRGVLQRRAPRSPASRPRCPSPARWPSSGRPLRPARSASHPCCFLGDISYSVYLWHWPLRTLAPYATGHPVDTVTTLTVLMLTILLAWLTKLLIEDPVRTGRLLARRRASWTFASAGAAPRCPDRRRLRQRAAAESTSAMPNAPRSICSPSSPTASPPPPATPQHPCDNPKLRLTVVPSPLEAHKQRGAPCPKIELRGLLYVCGFGERPSKAHRRPSP